jgi:hypothetical protein
MEPHAPESRRATKRALLVACGMLVLIAAFFLLREHWDHIAGRWVYLLLLACPLMHVFMHGGHGHAGHHDSPSTQGDADRQAGGK